MEKEHRINRRDFLKFSCVLASTLVMGVIKADEVFAKSPDCGSLYPDLKKEDLPDFYKEILNHVPPTNMTEEGVLQIEVQDIKGHRTYLPEGEVYPKKQDVTVAQTSVNKINMELSKKNTNFLFAPNQPLGLAWHWFGDLDGWKNTYAPNGSVQEYVDNGFGTNTSSMFLIGDKIPGIGGLKDKVSIAQCELPNKDGLPVQSAHILPVDRDLYKCNKQYFATVLDILGKEYFPELPYSYSVLQKMYTNGSNPAPNKQVIGIEILGTDFDNPENFPSIQKIANVLSVSASTIKHYGIKAAYDSYGHLEFDPRKGDPGKGFIFLMKTLLGLYALANNDKEFSDLVFGPFMTIEKDGKEAVQRYFDFTNKYFGLTASKEGYDKVVANIKYQQLKEVLDYLA